MKLSERIGRIKPSPTLSLDTKAKALKAAGEDIINFGAGEPDFNTPAHVKEAGIQAITDDFTRYTAAGGIPELKQAVADKFQKDNNLTYTPDQIVINCGGKHTLYNIFQVLLDEGDQVVVPAPYWVSYPPCVELAGGEAVIVPARESNQFKLTAEELDQACGPKTKAVIINSPSNPTGGVYSRRDLERLGEVVLKRNLLVITDDIYERIIYDGLEFINMAYLGPELKARTIIAHGLSKTYAMTGWRMGFLAGPKEVASAVTKLQSQSTSNPCSITQKAALAALTGPDDDVVTMVKAFDERRQYVVKTLNEMAGVSCFTPGGAFYAFPNVSSHYGKMAGDQPIDHSSDLCDYLLDKAKIAVVPGSAFGEDSCVRLSYAISLEDNKKGLDRMAEALGNLK